TVDPEAAPLETAGSTVADGVVVVRHAGASTPLHHAHATAATPAARVAEPARRQRAERSVRAAGTTLVSFSWLRSPCWTSGGAGARTGPIGAASASGISRSTGSGASDGSSSLCSASGGATKVRDSRNVRASAADVMCTIAIGSGPEGKPGKGGD